MLACNVCGKLFDEEGLLLRCCCGAPLSLYRSFAMNRGMIDYKQYGMWRYGKALPLDDVNSAVKIGEQFTPLVKREWNGSEVYFKYDIMPTGSFKDRGIAVMLNRLRELGVRSVYEDSSGNAGASIAAYCAAAGMPCEVIVPESTSRGKCVQIEAYGASLTKIAGPRNAASLYAEGRIPGANKYENVYASHNWSPYFVHGVKTWAFEAWEQLSLLSGDDDRIPDAVIVPAGQGSLALGAWLAFGDLARGGAVRKMPRIYAVQGASCPPIYNAWRNGLKNVPDAEPPKGKCMAEGIVSTRITRGEELLEALRGSGGGVLAIDDGRTVEALLKLAKAGIYVEPTSAVAAAAIDELQLSGELLAGECVVVLLSGSGLKTTPYIQEILDGRVI